MSSACDRCGREQPALGSPCPECETHERNPESGYRVLAGSSDLDRPVVIVDPQGFKVFSFKADQWDLAKEILTNLNSPANEWRDAA